MAGEPNEENDPPVVLTPVAAAKPWGPWATLGWTALCLFVFVVVQNLVAVPFVLVQASRGPIRAGDVAANGNLVGAATLVSTPAVLGLVVLLVGARRYPLRDYLALRLPQARQVWVSGGGLLVLLAATDSLSYALGRPIVPEVLVTMYRTAWPPLLLLAVLAVAPVGEETLMRGFLFQGIASSRWGPWAAIVLSSFAWAVIHVQYDLYGVATVFATGLYLGVVRQRTSSLFLTMLLHALGNAVATAELVYVVNHR
jgi:membrane protease YdiL (CAAX protease family)